MRRRMKERRRIGHPGDLEHQRIALGAAMMAISVLLTSREPATKENNPGEMGTLPSCSLTGWTRDKNNSDFYVA